MEVYEVLGDGIQEVRRFRFEGEHALSEATTEAKRLCDQYHVKVRVVRVIGFYSPESRWISYGVPGCG